MTSLRFFAGALVFLAACGTGGGSGTTTPSVVDPDGGDSVDASVPDDASASSDGAAAAMILARPYAWRAPATGTTPAPVLIFLHGIGASGVAQDTLYLQLGDESVRRGWAFASPDGTVGGDGRRFWNATDACCGGPRGNIDDVGYLSALLADLATKTSVDTRRVAVFGYSNGGFMAERFACDRASSLAAFVAFEGGGELDRSRCQPSAPVAALFLHGTTDPVVHIEGGAFSDTQLRYPALNDVMSTWQSRNNCSGPPVDTSERLDLETPPLGAETEKHVAPGCLPSAPLQHFRIVGGVHIPGLTPGWRTPVFDFLEGAFAARIQ